MKSLPAAQHTLAHGQAEAAQALRGIAHVPAGAQDIVEEPPRSQWTVTAGRATAVIGQATVILMNVSGSAAAGHCNTSSDDIHTL